MSTPWKHWCETCEGSGTVDETLGGEHFSNPKAECPDCEGRGYWSPHAAETDGPALPLSDPRTKNLIDAAPDLLEALILLEQEMVLSGNAGSIDYGWKPAIEKTRAAIAKANGSQP